MKGPAFPQLTSFWKVLGVWLSKMSRGCFSGGPDILCLPLLISVMEPGVTGKCAQVEEQTATSAVLGSLRVMESDFREPRRNYNRLSKPTSVYSQNSSSCFKD